MILRISWNVVKGLSYIMYFLTIIFFPFKPLWSTIMLFSIVAMWSRIPGMGFPVIGRYLMLFDVVDFFGVIIAINIGGWQGAVFSIIINLGSIFLGNETNFIFMIKDAICVFLACLITPFIYMATHDIGVTMGLFTLIRAFFFIPLHMIVPNLHTSEFIVRLIQVTTSLYLINLFYAKMFGNFFDSILSSGVDFSWTLFFLVTAVLVGAKLTNKIQERMQKNKTKEEAQCHYTGYNLA